MFGCRLGITARASPNRGSGSGVLRIHVRGDARLRARAQGVRPHAVTPADYPAPAGRAQDRHLHRQGLRRQLLRAA